MRSLVCLAALAVCFLPALTSRSLADHHKEAEAGFVTMFNGTDLTGWKINENPDSWSVVDGAIKSNGERSHLFYVGTDEYGDTAQTLDKPFRDFHFKAMVKTEPNANAGIYFHTRYQDSGWPKGGYEAQVNATHKDPKKTGSLYAVQNVMEAPHEDNVWFPYEIKVVGKQITFTVNGKEVLNYTEPEDAKPGDGFDRVLSAGTIALQAHDPGSVVYFKDLQIKRL